MIQSALLFTLGFLTASLFGLLLAPVIWRRAQWLMRQRLEAVVPMTLDEVRADRDGLRAQHAMAMRRLEIENEEIRAIDAEHLLEISRGREALKARAATISARDAQIAELDDAVARLSKQIRAREKELAAVEVSHRVAAREVAQRRDRIARLTEALEDAEREANHRSDLLRARETSDSERSDELSNARRDIGTLRQREATLGTALSEAQRDLAEANKRAERLDALLAEERERVAQVSKDLREADGRVRDALIDLAARVVAADGGLAAERLAHPDLPDGEIARRADTLGPSRSSSDMVDDGLMAEMDAAAEAELVSDGESRLPANDDGKPIAEPAHEERSPLRP